MRKELIEKAFIVKERWGNLILSGLKPWEIRGTGTQVRGRVGVIFSGTGMVYGSVEITGSEGKENSAGTCRSGKTPHPGSHMLCGKPENHKGQDEREQGSKEFIYADVRRTAFL